jgi:glycosyltransferase involved in cell wall biosynthesis
MDFGFRRADRIIVHGHALKRQVVEALGIAAEKIHVIPHVALGRIDETKCDDPLANRVLFFGRIWKYKGLDHLIRAQPRITAAVPDAKIVIAGEGDDFEPYRRLMDRPDRFIVHNRYISGPERDELFRQASVVVLPYIEATQSGVVPLAYAFGKPVVASNTGALSEAVDDGITGRLVPPANHSALATAVIELLRNPALRRAMGAAGQRKLQTERSPHVVAQQAKSVYLQAIQGRARRKLVAGNHRQFSSPSRHPTPNDLVPTTDT